MKFKDFLAEKAQKKCVFAFGRMNPPTTGHAKLVEKVKEIAKQNGADHLIVLSHSHDPKKNPLSPKEKIDRKSTRLNSSHIPLSRMPSSA